MKWVLHHYTLDGKLLLHLSYLSYNQSREEGENISTMLKLCAMMGVSTRKLHQVLDSEITL